MGRIQGSVQLHGNNIKLRLRCHKTCVHLLSRSVTSPGLSFYSSLSAQEFYSIFIAQEDGAF